MSAAVLPWWAWIGLAVVLWLAVLFTDEDRYRSLRLVLISGMILSALLGIIRFAKWAWNG
jgi:hypothetical protein